MAKKKVKKRLKVRAVAKAKVPKPTITHKDVEGEVCEIVDGKLVCKKQKLQVFEVKHG